MAPPSKNMLLAAVQVLTECDDDESFAIAEIMLRNILVERATAEAQNHLNKIGRKRNG